MTLDAILRPLAYLGSLERPTPAVADVAAYLGRRGLLAEAVRDGWFGLPVAGPSAASWVRMLADVRGEVGDASWLARGNGFQFGENRLCIPWPDPSGAVQTLQRRRIDGEKARKYVFPSGDTFRPLYPYGWDRVLPGDALALVEGAVDVLACRALGSKAKPIGIPGTSGWREEWDELVRGRTIVLALDLDAAGDKATADLGARLCELADVRLVNLPPGATDWGHALELRNERGRA